MLYADDLVVGQRFELGSYTISEEEILGFARQYDPSRYIPTRRRLPRARSVASLQVASTPWRSIKN
jgi:hypothetical protein